jgi:magnesium-transporting ATPase (P-type)
MGLAVYTGKETKVMMKSGVGRAKMSQIEHTANSAVIVIFIAQILLCIVTTLLSYNWNNLYGRSLESYLLIDVDSSEYVIPQWLGNFFTYLVLYNNFIPISLYVTVEMVNYMQAALVDVDPDMIDPETGVNARARTSNLNQDLGQIEYVFSDKTGTLTRNVMVFKACSIGGRAFGTLPGEDSQGDDAAATAVLKASARGLSSVGFESGAELLVPDSTVKEVELPSADVGPHPSPSQEAIRGISPAMGAGTPRTPRGIRSATLLNPLGPVGVTPLGPHSADKARGETPSAATARARSATTSFGGGVHVPSGVFFDQELSEVASGGSKTSAAMRLALQCDTMLTIMAVCHTVVPEEVEVEPVTKLVYQAESPDEGALVAAARDMGYRLIERAAHTITIQIAPPPQSVQQATSMSGSGVASPKDAVRVVFEKLGTHKFSSSRKRMSLIVKDPRHSVDAGGAWLLIKGADNAMLDIVSKDFRPGGSRERELDVVNAHLQVFAERGLRTLVLGRRWMSATELAEWKAAMFKAERVVGGKEDALERVAMEYERDVEIVGATAIEDRLQDGVPQTIADLARAGIKTWVLTGDKIETAINIGRTCRLLTEDMGEPMLITSSVRDLVLEELRSINHRLDRLELANDIVPDEPTLGLQSSISVSAPTARARQAPPPRMSGTCVPSSIPEPKRSVVPAPAGRRSQDRGCCARTLAAFLWFWGQLRLGASWNCGDGGVVSDAENAMPVRLPCAIVVKGTALDTIIRRGRDPKTRRKLVPDVELEREFLRAAQRCQAVIACRVSPKQKADIVSLVRNSRTPRPMTLAIGDGANDVGMIQAAQVGVGISGKEGLQAANAADFSFAQFRFLKRLLLVHGRWSYHRMSKVLLYSFYKNVVITMTLFLYNTTTAFSGTSLYESLVYSAYNFVLGLPIIAIGVLDQDVDQDTALNHPSVYVSGLRGLDLNVPKLTLWIFLGFVHGGLIYALSVLPFSLNSGPVWDGVAGHADGLFVAGLSVYTAMCWAMQGKVSLMTQHWTWVHWLMLAISMLGFFGFISGYQLMSSFAPEFAYVASATMSRPAFWLISLLCLVAVLVLDLGLETMRISCCPTMVDVATERAAGVIWSDDSDARAWGDERELREGARRDLEQREKASTPRLERRA